VIGAYQSGRDGRSAPSAERRTVFVSTHLIPEFEGLIDDFTIIDQGKELLTMNADAARDRFKKIRARFSQPPVDLILPTAITQRTTGRDVEVIANGNSDQILAAIKSRSPEDLTCESLTLEEIFVASKTLSRA
jgi:ABC-type multidrug transport system ATPase subunit